jgi:hypothetical protein
MLRIHWVPTSPAKTAAYRRVPNSRAAAFSGDSMRRTPARGRPILSRKFSSSMLEKGSSNSVLACPVGESMTWAR